LPFACLSLDWSGAEPKKRLLPRKLRIRAPRLQTPGFFWKHENGHFEKLADGTWKEVAADGGHAFIETNRTSNMVELTDRKRNIVISLFNGDCTAKVGSNKPTRLYDGLWLEKPASKLSPDPAMANKLATEFDLNGFRIRPPAGWTLEEKNPRGDQVFQLDWSTTRRWKCAAILGDGWKTIPCGTSRNLGQRLGRSSKSVAFIPGRLWGITR